MFAVIRRYEGIETAAIPEIMRSVNENLLPALGDIPGFVAYFALEEGNGVIASISVFRDRASADEGARVFADPARRSTGRDLLTAPQVTSGEILAHRLNAAPESRS
jgi:hypothetical protein